MSASETNRAMLVVWHDVVPGVEAEFEAWYQGEHLAERLALPGFLTARRYRGIGDGPGYLACYETETLAALDSPAYRARLADPTEQTRWIMPHFRNMTRSACTVVAEAGGRIGGVAGILTLAVQDEALAAREAMRAFAELLADPRLVRTRLCRGDAGTTRVPNPEARVRPQPDTMAEWLILVEGTTPEVVGGALTTLGGDSRLRDAAKPSGRPALFQLLCALAKDTIWA
jgi:hypothetical protein